MAQQMELPLRSRLRCELERKDRLWEAWSRRTQKLSRIAHPETGGSPHLIHNWGNDAARGVMARASRRWEAIREAMGRRIREAERRGPHVSQRR